MNGKNQRISPNLLKLIEKIREQEVERRGSCSYKDASEILYRRIMAAGGLKEDVILQ